MKKDRRRETGRIGEQLAAQHLKEKGYTILEMNWHHPLGELDLIAKKGDCLVIVEVRTTRSRNFGYGFQSINRQKQQQVRKLALLYLQNGHFPDISFRIDVISVLLASTDEPIQIDHLKGAF